MKSASLFRTACIVFLTIDVTSTAIFAADIGIKNGDFQSGKQFWKGDGTVVSLPDGNKVIELVSDKRRQNAITQEIEMDNLVAVEVQFRARFIGGAGQMRANLQKARGGSTLFAFDLPADGEWRNIRFKHTRENARDLRTLVLHTLPYDGKLQIDDVWAGEPGTHPSVRPMVPTTTLSPGPTTPSPTPSIVATVVPPNTVAKEKLLNDTEWMWASGGRLRLSTGGVARHTSWKADGTWKLNEERKLILQRPDSNQPMTVIFTTDDYQTGEVTSHTGATTAISRIKP